MSTQQDIYNIKQEVGLTDLALNNVFGFLLKNLYTKDFEKFPYKDRLEKTAKTLEGYMRKLDKAAPRTQYLRQTLEGLDRTLREQVEPLLGDLRKYEKWRTQNWKDGFESLDDELGKLLDIEPYVKRTEDIVGKNRQYLDRLAMEGKLYKSGRQARSAIKKEAKPAPKTSDAPAATTAGKVIAIIAFVAFGFTVLRGLNNLGLDTFGGTLPGASTGFFLMPGGPFVTSLQMVLFMLVSIVLIVYIFGKAVSDW